MSGPYAWEPPNYWLENNVKLGGAYGFLTEGGPGSNPMVYESLQKTIPHSELWPINFYWDYHCGNQQGLFGNLDYFTPPLNARYGESNSAKEYLYKSQVATYESHRAMFEAYSRNKYTSTGLIHWMLNNPWPSMIWHTYDYYLNPGGAFFGIKKALNPLHAVFSYNDGSVWLINSRYNYFYYIRVLATVYSLNGEVLFHSSNLVESIVPDGVRNLFDIPLTNLEGFYFVHLQVFNATTSDEIEMEDSFYWYNAKQDILDWEDSTFYITPCSAYADLTSLATLPNVNVTGTCSEVTSQNSKRTSLMCSINNLSDSIAFFIHLRIISNDEVVTPILWEDNMITLLPNGSKTVAVEFASHFENYSLNIEVYNNIV